MAALVSCTRACVANNKVPIRNFRLPDGRDIIHSFGSMARKLYLSVQLELCSFTNKGNVRARDRRTWSPHVIAARDTQFVKR